MPTVSVITPTYNVEPYIAQCIESVQAQTLTDWEMILVDDASTDGTVAVIERYLSDPRVKLFRNERNYGAGYTRNRALEAASGEWVAILDSDDWFAPQRLERLVEFAQSTQAQMVVDLQQYVGDSEEKTICIWSQFGTNPTSWRYYTATEVIKAHPSFKPLILRQFLCEHGIRFVPGIRKSQDYAFYVEILLRGARFAVLPEAMYFYRVRKGSITTIYHEQVAVEELTKSYDYLYELARQLGLDAEARALTQSFNKRKMLALYPLFAQHLKRLEFAKAFRLYRLAPNLLGYFLKNLPPALARRLRVTFFPLRNIQ